MILPYREKLPQDLGAAYIAPTAQIIGEVTLHPDSSVWFGAVLRADRGAIEIGPESNVQDNATLHCGHGTRLTLGRRVTVGHAAIVHGCTVGDGTLVGMHATLLNHCVVGKGCIIGAGALVPEGMVIPDGMLAVGVPARILRPVTPAQAESSLRNAEQYVELAREYAAGQSGRTPEK